MTILTLTPSFLAADANAVSRAPTYAGLVAEMRVKSIVCPLGIPGPHSPVPVPGRSQTVAPSGTTFQPWPVSSFPAAAGSYG